MINCARPECGVIFEPRTHNQKFCCSECCRINTNRRIMEKYYERQAQRLGLERLCVDCQKTKLSRYNDTMVCGPCALKKVEESRKSVVSMFAAVAWQ